ncbi:MAG TPA: acetolactate synthase large subunit [Bryobacteraceae bacterium]|nr:acetolactate synthase large subunit [Bryobacteraceae bacterium]
MLRTNMTGAECLMTTLVANRIGVCFMNPGTSEMHFVAGLDRVPELRGVLCLYEGVCSGAADGYARMHGKPAATLLHLGPGLGNALSNFHNARKARSPVVCIVGEHSTGHLKYDAPLTSDIAAFARTVSNQIRTVESSQGLGASVSDTIASALAPPGQIAMLIVPADFSWLRAGPPGAVVACTQRSMPSQECIRDAARVLRSVRGRAGLILGGSSPCARGLEAAGRLASETGVQVFIDRIAPRFSLGRGHYPAPKVPYFPEDARAAFADLSHLILVEAEAPVSFFGYPDTPSSPVPETCAISTLATREQDGTGGLEALAEECGARKLFHIPDQAAATSADGPLTLDAVGQALAALMPESAIVSDEMVSSGAVILPHLARAAAHDQLPITGGSIGQGLPVAVGAAIACPGRKVVALEADGSAMYSVQALWTLARENLDVVIVILANRRYRILDIEMRRTGAPSIGQHANDMLDLGRPDLDFVSMAHGMGVPATRATTAEEFSKQFGMAIKEQGPSLIEAVLCN